MTKLIRRVPAAVWAGVSVLLFGALWSRLPGAGFMGVFCTAIAAWCFVYGGCRLIPRRRVQTVFCRILLAVLAGALLLLLVTGTLILMNVSGDDVSDARVALVFGAGVEGDRPSATLRTRLETALAWWEENPSRLLVLSGGKGDDENLPEARVMANWLMENGVPEEALFVEDQAADTRENVAFSVPILDELLEPGEPLAAISSEFHLYRCKYLFRSAGYEGLGLPAGTPYGYLTVTYCLRECCAIVVDWLGL